MATLLVKNIDLLATFDDQCREISGGALFLRDNVIEKVGKTADLAGLEADVTLDLSGHVVMPGMVNTHHHMYQNQIRFMVQDDELDALSDLGRARRRCDRRLARVSSWPS